MPTFGRMARYYFHIFENGEVTVDEVGVDLSSDDKVRVEAMQLLPEIARDEVPQDGNQQAFTVLVTDEAGRSVYTATLSFAGLSLRM